MSPEEFANEFGPEMTPPPMADPHPYGIPVHPIKPGLTKRGRAAVAVAATVIAGGGMLGWQHYAAQQATASVKAQEIALKQQELRLQELKAMNDINAANQKTQTTADAARQKKVDACVQDNKGLVGKQLGATYRSVLEDCQAQYPSSSTGQDMQEAASSTNSGGGGVNNGLLIGAGVLVLGTGIAVRNKARNNTHGHYA
ncbi:hypothetical protein ACFV0T_26225 [Streptomyces sp. NPDC059582]|uniref:hypothetical protein n=1 Tax=Streptomyces sp. NPDC059582 TaxID=3346875 RepID=UPI0036A0BD05